MKFIQKPKKSLGQNFLIDKNIIDKIVKIGNINKSKTVVEIGAGYGNLTKSIIKSKPKKIYAIEKDKNLSLNLNTNFKSYKNINIINGDIMVLLKNKKYGTNTIIFGNLPYNISTQILSSLILLKEWPPWYDMLIFMFQKEVAERIIAKPKTKNFNRLAVLANWRLEVKKHFDVSSNCFTPKPKINSTVLSFVPKKINKYNLKNPKNLEKVTRVLFSNKRKMINKNFNKLFNQNSLVNKSLNINLKLRAEELSHETFYKIAMKYEKLFG